MSINSNNVLIVQMIQALDGFILHPHARQDKGVVLQHKECAVTATIASRYTDGDSAVLSVSLGEDIPRMLLLHQTDVAYIAAMLAEMVRASIRRIVREQRDYLDMISKAVAGTPYYLFGSEEAYQVLRNADSSVIPYIGIKAVTPGNKKDTPRIEAYACAADGARLFGYKFFTGERTEDGIRRAVEAVLEAAAAGI